jgi:hypothetical protein
MGDCMYKFDDGAGGWECRLHPPNPDGEFVEVPEDCWCGDRKEPKANKGRVR